MTHDALIALFAWGGFDQSIAKPLSLQKRLALQPDGTIAETKRPHPTYFALRTYPAPSLDDLGSSLAALAQHPHAAATWSDPTPTDVETGRPHDFDWFRRKGNLTTTAKSWLTLDLDELSKEAQATAKGIPPRDLVALDRALRPLFPPTFHNVRGVIQATSGHGLKGTRLRWWFKLSRPVRAHEIQQLLSGSRLDFDMSVFHTGQPIYTADPILDGISDPMQGYPRLAFTHNASDAPSAVPVAFPPLEPPPRPEGSRAPASALQHHSPAPTTPEHRSRVLCALRYLNDAGCFAPAGNSVYSTHVFPTATALLNVFGPNLAEELLCEAETPIAYAGYRDGFWRALVQSSATATNRRYTEGTIFHLVRELERSTGTPWQDPHPEINPKAVARKEQALARLQQLAAEPARFPSSAGTPFAAPDADDLTAPQLTLDEMFGRLVSINGRQQGTLVFDAETRTVRPHENAARFYAASKVEMPTGKKTPQGKPRTNADGSAETDEVPVFPIWANDARPDHRRLTVETLTWRPGAPILTKDPQGRPAANFYRPPRRYPLPRMSELDGVLAPFFEHLNWLFSGAPDQAQLVSRFIQWLAHAFQRPEEVPSTAWVFITPQTGTGRGSLFALLIKVFDGIARRDLNLTALLETEFNDQLSELQLAMVNEVSEGVAGRDRQRKADKLKEMVDAHHVRINEKFGHTRYEFNAARWIFASNHWHAIPIDRLDRRFIVIANPTTKPPREHLARFHAANASPEFIGAVQHCLATLDLSGFSSHAEAPMTGAKQRALEAVTNDEATFVTDFARDWPAPIATTSQMQEYVRRRQGVTTRPAISHLRHYYDDAGVIPTSRRIRMSDGDRPSVIIVHQHGMTDETLKAMPAEGLVTLLDKASRDFQWPPDPRLRSAVGTPQQLTYASPVAK